MDMTATPEQISTTSTAKPTAQALVRFLHGAGLTYEQIAEEVGSNWRSVYRWAGGAKALSIYQRSLLKLATAKGFAANV